MSIEKEIPELLEAGIISPETAGKMYEYYSQKRGNTGSRLFLAFGIVGALLVGLGIILIIAHNWDQLPRAVKTSFAFLPLILGQLLCTYVLIKKNNSKTWRESSATFLVFAVGACISLVGQIYHIPGNLSSLLQVWLLLILPIIYILRSAMTAILYITGITILLFETGYNTSNSLEDYIYWPLLLAVLPQYFYLLKRRVNSNFVRLESWLLAISLTIALGTFADAAPYFLYVAYFGLFAIFYLFAKTDFFQQSTLSKNPFNLLGILGTIVLLFITGYEDFWTSLYDEAVFGNVSLSIEFWVALITSVLALAMFFLILKQNSLYSLFPYAPIFLIFILLFIIGHFTVFAVLAVNLIILAIGIYNIVQGSKTEHLGILNFGLSIITVWMGIRFLNSDLSFIVRGLLFMVMGIGFFTANYFILINRKRHGK